METKFKLTRFGNFCICVFSFTTIFFGCKKSEGITKVNKPQLDLVSRDNILKIAPTREKFNDWVDTVFKYKLEDSQAYQSDTQSKYDIQKVTFTQIDSFKIAEVFIKTDHSAFNFFIGTLFDFTQAPEYKQYVLKPITTTSTPIRTLIFSSGNDGTTSMSLSIDTFYTFKTVQNNLFFLGAR